MFLFNKIRFNLLLIGLALLGGWWLFRVSPAIFFIFFILAIFIGRWAYKRIKFEKQMAPTWEKSRQKEAESKKQATTQATPELFEKAYSLVKLLGFEGTMSAKELELAIRKKVKFDVKTDEVTEMDLWRYLFDLLCDYKAAFWVDWKWGDPQYMTENDIVKILPELKPQFKIQEKSTEKKGNWHIQGNLMDEEFDATVDDGIPHDYIEKVVNPILVKKIRKKFASYNSGGDDHDFVLVPVENFEQATSATYKEFWG